MIFLFIIIIIAQFFLYSIAIIIDSYTAFGNELTAAFNLYHDLHINLPNQYVNDISTCYIYDPWCFRGKNSNYAAQVKFWNPKYLIDPEKDLYYRKAKDCTYEIKQVNWSNTMNMNHGKSITGPTHWEIFEFTMLQSSCQENITRADFPKTGGSTFTTIGYNNESLIACTCTDYLNAYYNISCRFPKYYHNNTMKTNEKLKTCMNLTVALEYEHFDGYSAVLGSNSHDDYLYPPIKYLIADDVEYCLDVEFPLLSRNQVSQVPNTSEFLLDLNGTGMTSYFTGYWLNQETVLQKLHSLYTLHKDRLVMAFDYYSKVNRLNYYSVTQLPSPKLVTKRISDQLVFKSFLLRNFQYISEDRDHLETILSHNYSHAHEHHYHMIGASHMRYNFNYIVSLLYGDENLPDARKYNEEHVETFHMKGAEKMDLLVSEIQRLCTSNFEYSHYTYDPTTEQQRIHTLVFQFGAWDLQASPLELLINTSGLNFKKIHSIFSDPTYCKNLVHIVFITAVPYPLCYDESDKPCYQLRGMSNNGAISALNRHTIKELLDLKRQFKDSVKLSIVDAYSIIKPRILLDNFKEVVCSFHYLCREKINGNYQNIATVGGLAIVEALLLLFREQNKNFG